jgi:hypothetical protein
MLSTNGRGRFRWCRRSTKPPRHRRGAIDGGIPVTGARNCACVGAAAAAALVAGGTGSAAEQASRIIDRTLVCPISGVGYPDPARFLDAQAIPRLGDSSPHAGVYNAPSAADGVYADFKTGPDFGRGTGWVRLKGCTASRLRVRLSSRGLTGGPTALGDRQKCEVPARVLIRLRAVFKRPVTPRRAEGMLVAHGSIAAGYVAVATLPGRKPLVFASVGDATGKARLFVSRSTCVPNP